MHIHPSAEVHASAAIGSGTRIWHWVHVREDVRLGCDCVLGQGVYVDRGVTVGDRVKLENGVSVFAGVTIEDDVFVGPGATFTNDRYPRADGGTWQVLPTAVRRGASVGANATIVCGVTLGEWCMVAAGAVVTHSVPPHTLVAGNPARPRGRVCRCGRPLRGAAQCPACGRPAP